MSPNVNVIYIAGYGRSGSTLLDIVLGASKEIYGVGALSNLFKWVSDASTCSCGENIGDCLFWGKVLKKLDIEKRNSKEIFELCRSVEKRRWLRGRPTKIMAQQYMKLQYDLFLAIKNEVKTQYILDSSKSSKASFNRPYLLHQAGCNVKVIHLSRDGRGVLWSVLKKLGSPEWKSRKAPTPVRAIRSIVGWNLANHQAFRLKKLFSKENYLHLSYEEFMLAPDKTLGKVATFLDISVSELVHPLHGEGGFAAEHNIGGNRLRFNKNIRLNPDFEWKKQLPWYYRVMFWVMSWRMMSRLGYINK